MLSVRLSVQRGGGGVPHGLWSQVLSLGEGVLLVLSLVLSGVLTRVLLVLSQVLTRRRGYPCPKDLTGVPPTLPPPPRQYQDRGNPLSSPHVGPGLGVPQPLPSCQDQDRGYPFPPAHAGPGQGVPPSANGQYIPRIEYAVGIRYASCGHAGGLSC